MSDIKYLACVKCGVMPDAPTATRLRRVCNALNLMSDIPDDDLVLYRSMFSMLGIIVRKVEALAAAIAHLQLENAKFRDVLEFYKCFSDSRISSIAQTALLNITTAEEVTHNKPDDERKEFEDWLEDFKAQHEEWQYADSEAMYFAAWQARANLSM